MADEFRAASGPQIATLVARSLASFETLTSVLTDDHALSLQVSSCLARFKLWAGNLGAHRPSGSRSLEYRLRDASRIRQHVISLLRDLCSSVEEATLVSNAGSISDTPSEDHNSLEDALADYFNEGEDSEKSEVERIVGDISHVVNCLLRLSITISNPTPHDQYLSRAGEVLIKSFEHWDIQHVRAKFPGVSSGLADRLGRAMARRRGYFKYREEHKNRLAEGLDAEEAEQATTIASSLPEHLKEGNDNARAGATPFAMLDDGRPDASETSCSSSNPNSTQLRVPPIPKEYLDGPFKCPFCHMIISVESRHDWKKHVFGDLRPYVCLSEACSTPDHLYLRRRDWVTHMQHEHWKTWHCPFGCVEGFNSAKSFKDHLNATHEQYLSPENKHTLLSLSSRSDMSKSNGQCPLCHGFQVGSETQYARHIGQHLEHLALFTLPSLEKAGSESEIDDKDGDCPDSPASLITTKPANAAMDDFWTHSFCLACDKNLHTAGDAYCSESCRLADLEKTFPPSFQASAFSFTPPSHSSPSIMEDHESPSLYNPEREQSLAQTHLNTRDPVSPSTIKESDANEPDESSEVVSTQDLVNMDSLLSHSPSTRVNYIHQSVRDFLLGGADTPDPLSPDTKRVSRLAPDRWGNEIPLNADWTKISRTLVGPEALERAGVRYEVRPEYVAVLGSLSQEQIASLVHESKKDRAGRIGRLSEAARGNNYDSDIG
ncbi:hypothetical protein QQX98_008032 [Neonectria punicea]|uniref:C2H2-type domain-containing protein n=1 Tax=Neonectria punicea TaxID=979145 RepID=A0ABR1GWA3_9HYPO